MSVSVSVSVYGRGALGTKGGGIVRLAAFIALRRAGAVLNRDVVFMATADEEAGGFFGVGWLVDQHPDVFDGIDYVINEGGSGSVVDGRVQFAVEVTQKVPYWLRLTTRGESGHGSRPRAVSSVTHLVAALDRLREHEFEARVIPAVDAYFKGIAAAAPAKWRDRYGDMAAAIREPGVAAELQQDNPGLHGLIRNTCSMTRLSGSNKINVVPNEAWAELDCRLLPDQDPEAFLDEMRAILGDQVAIETLMGFTPAVSSAETVLYGAILDVTRTHFPNAVVVPAVLSAFTDSHFLRDLGMTAYGFAPFAIPVEDRGGVHGNNERVSAENVRRGVTMMLDIVQQLAVDSRIRD